MNSIMLVSTNEMLFCGFLLCVGFYVSLAIPDHQIPSEDDIASSPVIQHLIQRVEMLERQGEKQANEIQSLKAEMSQQRYYMKSLRSKLYAKDRKIQTLQSRVANRSDVDDIPANGEMERIGSKISPLPKGNRQTRQTKDTVKRIQPVEHIMAAFSAEVWIKPFTVPANNTDIVFNHVFTNVGNAYNRRTGQFIAPVSGVYVLSANLRSQRNDTRLAYVVVNYEVWTHIHMRDIYDTNSITVFLEVNKGDPVSIQGQPGDEFLGTFSGFLLYQGYTNDWDNVIVG